MSHASGKYRSCVINILTVASLLAGTSMTNAIISLDANFDHGSLESYSLSGNNVNLIGRDNYFGSNQWRWVYFKASGVNGLSPNFRISTNFAGGSSAIQYQNFRYSYDNENWTTFDNHGISDSTFNFSNNTTFSQDDVWIAFSLPYSYGRMADKVAEYKLNPYVSPTISSDSNLVIGQSPGGIDDLGRTIGPRDLWAFKITDNTEPSEGKTKIVLTSGLHANEVLGSHTLEGTLDWLLSNDSRAAELLKVAEFYVYPMLNPDGRFAGYNRSTVYNPNQDPNRDWSPSIVGRTWYDEPEIQLSGEAMMADLQVAQGGEADYFIDYHSSITTGSDADDFVYLHPEKGHTADPFWQYFMEETETVTWWQSTSTGPTTANFGEIELGADFDATFETVFHPSRGEDYYDELGKDVGVAFFLALAHIDADINADGFVGLADLDVILSNWNQTVPVGDKSQGDLAGIGDGYVGLSDLDVILNNWNQGTPPSLSVMNIPEPASVMLLGLTTCSLLSRRGRSA